MIKIETYYKIFVFILIFYVYNQFFIELFPFTSTQIRILRVIADVVLIFISVLLTKRNVNKILFYIPFIFVIISTITFLFNSNTVDFITHLNGIREPLVLFCSSIIYNALLNSSDGLKYFKRISSLLIIIAISQIPISFYQFSKFGAGDSVGGSFSDGGSGALTVFLIIIFGYYYYINKYFLKNEKSISIFLKSIIFLIPCFINETKITFFLVPLFFIVISFEKRNIYKQAFYILIISMILYGFNNIYNNIDKQDVSAKSLYFTDIFNPDFFYNYFFGGDVYSNEIPRLLKISLSFEKLRENDFKLLFGVGFGIFKGQNILGTSDIQAVYYHLYWGSRTLYDAVFVQGGLMYILVLISFIIINVFGIGNNIVSRINKFNLSILSVIIITSFYHDAFLVYYYSILISYFLSFCYNHDKLLSALENKIFINKQKESYFNH